MSDEEWSTGPSAVSDGQVAFDYIKAGDFRAVWADGAIGGVTPAGLLHFALYSERPALPRRQVFEVIDTPGEGQQLGAEILEKLISRQSIVREMSVDVLITARVAESLAQWLMQQVELMKSQMVVK